MITWITRKYQEIITREAAKERCGVSPFQLPRGFPLTSCCGQHDRTYIELRELALSEAQAFKVDLAYNPDFLDRYKERILEADIKFAECNNEIAKSWWLRLSAKFFIHIVDRVGFDVWKSGTIKAQPMIGNPYRFP